MNISPAEINEDGFPHYGVPDNDDGNTDMVCDQTLKNIWSPMNFQYDVFVRLLSLRPTCPEYLHPKMYTEVVLDHLTGW